MLVAVFAAACGDAGSNQETAPPAQQVSRPECVGYDTTVSITGLLRRETHPGRPNFESIAEGDEPETGLYLVLREPICGYDDPNGVDRYPVDSATRIQLVLDAREYAVLRRRLGSEVTLSGELFPAFTGHHHAPLLLWKIVVPK